jgi:hypothetical protein
LRHETERMLCVQSGCQTRSLVRVLHLSFFRWGSFQKAIQRLMSPSRM